MANGNVVQWRNRHGSNEIPQSTYGALAESNVSALEALLGEVRRTNAHVLWLEDYVSKLPEHLVFDGNSPFTQEQELKWLHEGGRPTEGSIAWLLAVEQAKQSGMTFAPRGKPQVHMAVQQLMRERAHLLNACTAAIRCGIALDEVELAKQQGEMLINAMTRFAEGMGLDPADKRIAQGILDALDNPASDTSGQ